MTMWYFEISVLFLSLSVLYRLWQDAENRILLSTLLHKNSNQVIIFQVFFFLSVCVDSGFVMEMFFFYIFFWYFMAETKDSNSGR